MSTTTSRTRKPRPRPRSEVRRRLVVNPAHRCTSPAPRVAAGDQPPQGPVQSRVGVDVADSQARKAALREGQIWAFFATKERAEKFTAARQTEGYDAIVVAATAKEVE